MFRQTQTTSKCEIGFTQITKFAASKIHIREGLQTSGGGRPNGIHHLARDKGGRVVVKR